MTRRLSALPSTVGTIDLAVQKLGTDNIFVWGPSPDMSHRIVALYRFRAAALVVVAGSARWRKVIDYRVAFCSYGRPEGCQRHRGARDPR